MWSDEDQIRSAELLLDCLAEINVGWTGEGGGRSCFWLTLDALTNNRCSFVFVVAVDVDDDDDVDVVPGGVVVPSVPRGKLRSTAS